MRTNHFADNRLHSKNRSRRFHRAIPIARELSPKRRLLRLSLSPHPQNSVIPLELAILIVRAEARKAPQPTSC
jgi:hypothetical protein